GHTGTPRGEVLTKNAARVQPSSETGAVLFCEMDFWPEATRLVLVKAHGSAAGDAPSLAVRNDELRRDRGTVCSSFLRTLSTKGYAVRLTSSFLLALALVSLAVPARHAQGQDAARAVAGGGISVTGWTGKVDPNEEKAGQTVNNAKFAKEGNDFHI